MRTVHAVASAAILVLSIYIGFGNTHDIFNTITIPQRLVGVGATIYALLGIVLLYGIWRRPAWLLRVTLVWGVLVVGTALLASIVYGGQPSANLLVVAICGVLSAIVILYAWGQRRQS